MMPSGATILVADDDKAIRTVLSHAFARHGCATATATW